MRKHGPTHAPRRHSADLSTPTLLCLRAHADPFPGGGAGVSLAPLLELACLHAPSRLSPSLPPNSPHVPQYPTCFPTSKLPHCDLTLMYGTRANTHARPQVQMARLTAEFQTVTEDWKRKFSTRRWDAISQQSRAWNGPETPGPLVALRQAEAPALAPRCFALHAATGT